MCESLTGKRDNDPNLMRFEDPRTALFNGVLPQRGVLPIMLSGNPDLRQHLINLFVGEKNILIVGGESGMGKSLITTDIRGLHEDINAKLPPQLKVPLVVVSWDRTHAALFEAASVESGSTLSLPKGETHPRGRRIASHVIGDVVRYTKKYIHPNSKIIIETPLIDIRGETLYEELSDMRGQIQTLIMHSPESRERTLAEGRLMHTSGQPDSMNQIREKLFKVLWVEIMLAFLKKLEMMLYIDGGRKD